MCLILTPRLSPVLQFPSKASAWGKGGGREENRNPGQPCGSQKEMGGWGPAWGSSEGAEITEQHLLIGR